MQRYIIFVRVKKDTLILKPDMRHRARMNEKTKAGKYFSPYLWVTPHTFKFSAWSVDERIHSQQMLKSGDCIVVGRLPGYWRIDSIQDGRVILKKFDKDRTFTGEAVELTDGCYSVAYTGYEAVEKGMFHRMPYQKGKCELTA